MNKYFHATKRSIAYVVGTDRTYSVRTNPNNEQSWRKIVFEHVSTLFNDLLSVGNTSASWKLEKSAFHYLFVHSQRVLKDFKNHYLSFCSIPNGKACAIHITAFVSLLASWINATPVRLVEVKKVNFSLISPLHGIVTLRIRSPLMQKYSTTDWILEETAIRYTKSGSIGSNFLSAVLKHIWKEACEHFPCCIWLLLVLDNQGSLDGLVQILAYCRPKIHAKLNASESIYLTQSYAKTNQPQST